MPTKRTYKFEVEVTHVGPRKDFAFFFSERRQAASYKEAREISQVEEKLTAASIEVQAAQRDKEIRNLLKLCISHAGCILIKPREIYRKDPNKPAIDPRKAICINKTRDNYYLSTRAGGMTLSIKPVDQDKIGIYRRGQKITELNISAPEAFHQLVKIIQEAC